MADEIGKKGTPHTHIYVCFTSRVRFSTIKKHFQPANIKQAYGSVQENIDYIKKTGKWVDTEKEKTKVEGTFEEWGVPPKQKGIKPDMEELLELIKAGYTNAQLLELNADYILNIEKLDKVRTTILIDKYKRHRRLNLKVVYISGPTGLGKTRYILDKHGDENVYRINDYARSPFDHYDTQPVLCFDEFRSSLKLSDMLQYCDIYPLVLPARYSNKFACYETVYIISNWPLEKQYEELQLNDPESWAAFLKRIHEVWVYNTDGTVNVYDSPKTYYAARVDGFRFTKISDNNFNQLIGKNSYD